MQTPPCLMPRGDKGGAVRSAAGAAGTASLKECGKVGPGTLSLRLRLRKVSQSDINGNRRTVRARCATRSFPLLQTDETQDGRDPGRSSTPCRALSRRAPRPPANVTDSTSQDPRIQLSLATSAAAAQTTLLPVRNLLIFCRDTDHLTCHVFTYTCSPTVSPAPSPASRSTRAP